jgi:hypothetical protein
MQGFILKQNVARYAALPAKEHGAFDRQIVKEPLASMLRDYVVSEDGSASLIAEIDIRLSHAQNAMFRNALEVSDDPHLMLDPRKGLHIVSINPARGQATISSSARGGKSYARGFRCVGD